MSVQKYLMEMLNEGSCNKDKEMVDESGMKDLLITCWHKFLFRFFIPSN
jgi:hypothetical protein